MTNEEFIAWLDGYTEANAYYNEEERHYHEPIRNKLNELKASKAVPLLDGVNVWNGLPPFGSGNLDVKMGHANHTAPFDKTPEEELLSYHSYVLCKTCGEKVNGPHYCKCPITDLAIVKEPIPVKESVESKWRKADDVPDDARIVLCLTHSGYSIAWHDTRWITKNLDLRVLCWQDIEEPVKGVDYD